LLSTESNSLCRRVESVDSIPGVDSNKVDASDLHCFRYSRWLFRLVNYSSAAIVSGSSPGKSSNTNALVADRNSWKTLVDSIVGLRLARIEWRDNEAFCAYCQVATLWSNTIQILFRDKPLDRQALRLFALQSANEVPSIIQSNLLPRSLFLALRFVLLKHTVLVHEHTWS